MATKLINPVRREVPLGRHGYLYIVTLDNDLTITFKRKNKKYKETVSLEACKHMATIASAEKRYQEAMEKYKAKKAAGKRAKKPKKPRISEMFRKEYSMALNLSKTK